MTHTDHVKLIRGGIQEIGGVWADLGSGEGAFTLALREILGTDAVIYSVDKDITRLNIQERLFDELYPGSDIRIIHNDLREDLPLPQLDGILMANSLHFFRDKNPVLKHILQYMKGKGIFLLVEYNSDEGNTWVPYPLSYQSFDTLCDELPLTKPEFIGNIPSSFLKEIYCAKTLKSD